MASPNTTNSHLILLLTTDSQCQWPARLQSLVTVVPNVAFKDQGLFDFSLRVEIDEAASLGSFPACLSVQVRTALSLL